jgi:Phage terminase large subunit
MQPTFRLVKNSLQDRFLQSRAELQVFGGGFGNGKSTSCIIKLLQVAKDYPGANILVFRESLAKLQDSTLVEFEKWCPDDWIQSFPKNEGARTCVLKNGTRIAFRFVRQQGKKGADQGTSNLLSANYDLIFGDQIEDPQIAHKDFLDLYGRLRGSTPYAGTDPTMPKTGPRWLLLNCNPTRNWFYKKIIRPYHLWQKDGKYHKDLQCRMKDGVPILDAEGRAIPIMELFEGATHENADNLPPDFIARIEASYVGQMRDRFLLGKWAAYEGLIYSEYSDDTHLISADHMRQYYHSLRMLGYEPEIIEAYDDGIAKPYCYLLAFVDHMGIVHVVDGSYEKEVRIEEIIRTIKTKRIQLTGQASRKSHDWVYADPSLMRRTRGGSKSVIGNTTSELFWDNGCGIRFVPGNNDIKNGIIKCSSYLFVDPRQANPYTGEQGSPHIFIANNLYWFDEEINEYSWQKNASGEDYEEKPRDGNDHAMDAMKYMLSRRPDVAKIIPQPIVLPQAVNMWHESSVTNSKKEYRHGR